MGAPCCDASVGVPVNTSLSLVAVTSVSVAGVPGCTVIAAGWARALAMDLSAAISGGSQAIMVDGIGPTTNLPPLIWYAPPRRLQPPAMLTRPSAKFSVIGLAGEGKKASMRWPWTLVADCRAQWWPVSTAEDTPALADAEAGAEVDTLAPVEGLLQADSTSVEAAMVVRAIKLRGLTGRRRRKGIGFSSCSHCPKCSALLRQIAGRSTDLQSALVPCQGASCSKASSRQ